MLHASLSPLALGCEPLGGQDWGEVDPKSVRDAVRCALECGISVFDTADVYGLGRGEEALADALGADRHRVTIVTKGGVRWGPPDAGGRSLTRRDASAAYLTAAIEASLRRLKVEVIPLYLVHWPDPATPIEETIDCLERARVAGRIRDFGLSNVDVDAMRTAVASSSLSAIEGELNLLSPPSVVDEYAAARALGLAALTYGPLAQGLLTGKYDSGSVFDTSDRRHRLMHFAPAAFDRNSDVLAVLGEVAKETGRSPAQVAVRWVLQTGVANSVIIGAKTPSQVRENAQSLTWVLDIRDVARLATARSSIEVR